LEAGLGGRGGDVEVTAALADGVGWLRLLPVGSARDGGSCSLHSRKD